MTPERAGPAAEARHYIGRELEVFAEARIWRSYWQDQIRRFVGERVLEVGAGLGAVARTLASPKMRPNVREWVALEPDPEMAEALAAMAARGDLPSCCRPRRGTVADLDLGEVFDTILYIDVLEHIADDADELARAAGHLAPGGALIVLAPAHAWLYSSFDAAIGHHRRYTRAGLLGLAPPGLSAVRARYLDSVGLLASGANRALLTQAMPTRGQIRVWDRVMVRASRVLDGLSGFRLGKSVLVVWRAP